MTPWVPREQASVSVKVVCAHVPVLVQAEPVTVRERVPSWSQVSLKPQALQLPGVDAPQTVFTGLLLQAEVERLGLQTWQLAAGFNVHSSPERWGAHCRFAGMGHT